jgi:hypothetical protein
MKPIVIVSPLFVKMVSIFINVYAITLFPFIVSREKLDEKTLNHESIHFRQQIELFIIFFYILYIFDWIKGLIKYRSASSAYYRIRFEQEAYQNENNKFYLLTRKRNSWKRFRI